VDLKRRVVGIPGKGLAEFGYGHGLILPPWLFHNTALRGFGFRRVIEAQLVPKRTAEPLQKQDQDRDLDGPILNLVDDPMGVETRSTHTISYPAVRKIVPTLLQGASLQTVAPAGEPKISKKQKQKKFFKE
jgi:hypothetical protein